MKGCTWRIFTLCGYQGGKIEANASKYSFVWKKSVEKHKEKLAEKIKAVLGEIKSVIAADDAAPDTPERVAIDSKVLSEEIAKMNEKLKKSKEEKENKEVEKQLKDLTEKKLPKLQAYEDKLSILGDRNSYAKTDGGATKLFCAIFTTIFTLFLPIASP